MTEPHDKEWQLWPLPIIVGIVPVAVALLAAYIAMRTNSVPACMPFLEGCTSVSSVGRYPPASYVFRGVLLPFAAFYAMYWYLTGHWLRSLSPKNHRVAGWATALGIAAAVFLVVYVVLLGSKGDAYELMRRYGIYFFFLFTFISELLTAIAFDRALPGLRTVTRLQFGLCGLMFGSGLLNLVLKQVLADANSSENVIEWNFAILMFLNICLVAPGWRATGYRWQLSFGTRA